MRRTALELSTALRDAWESQSADAYESLLEDINDSVGDTDLSQYVPKKDYDDMVSQRDAQIVKTQEYRDKYINRFYEPGKAPNDQTYISSQANQMTLEKDEYDVSYESLFE